MNDRLRAFYHDQEMQRRRDEQRLKDDFKSVPRTSHHFQEEAIEHINYNKSENKKLLELINSQGQMINDLHAKLYDFNKRLEKLETPPF